MSSVDEISPEWGIDDNPQRSGGASGEPQATSSLDLATLTVLCRPTCGEATTRLSSARPVSALEAENRAVSHARSLLRRKGRTGDPERSLEEADRRAKAGIRRWCVHRRASRLATLTYREGVWEWSTVWADIERLRRELDAASFNDSVLAYPEGHPGPTDVNGVQVADSHGWHIHLAVAKFVPVDVLRSCWERATSNAGFVDIRKIRVRGGRAVGGREAARVTARYVAKAISGYATKAHRAPLATARRADGFEENIAAFSWT